MTQESTEETQHHHHHEVPESSCPSSPLLTHNPQYLHKSFTKQHSFYCMDKYKEDDCESLKQVALD